MARSTQTLSGLLHSGYRYAMSLTHHSTKAEDLLQDAWVAVLKSNGPIKQAYLFSAIRSQFINQYRREKLIAMVPLESMPDWEQNCQYEEDLYIDVGILETALAQLRPIEREALYLHIVEGYSTVEVANLTQQPKGTVLSLIYRARKKLRRWLVNDSIKAKS